MYGRSCSACIWCTRTPSSRSFSRSSTSSSATGSPLASGRMTSVPGPTCASTSSGRPAAGNGRCMASRMPEGAGSRTGERFRPWDDAPVADRLSSRTIVGRAEPLRLLGVLLDAVARSQPQLLLVTGEPGVGKTRLLGELERRAGERGMLLLHGECVDFGGAELPYAPFVGALRDVPAGRSLDDDRRGALAGLFPRLGGTTRAGDAFGQARLFELLLELLGELAARAPILLALEDVHWADRSSRDVLAFLARNLTRERVAVALTCRTGELPAEHPLRRLLAELSRRPNVTRVDLAPLDRAGVALQLEAIAGAPVDDALAGELHARSGGNPFFVEELFAARSDGGLPATLAEAVLARIGRLPDDAREVLAELGAAGGRTDAGVLEAAVGIDLGPPLRAALDAGLVVRDGEALALRHGLIGEVLYERLAPGERAALHAALAEALAGAGAP